MKILSIWRFPLNILFFKNSSRAVIVLAQKLVSNFAHNFLCKRLGCIYSKHNDLLRNNAFEFGCWNCNTVWTYTAGSVWYLRNMRVAVELVLLVCFTSLARSKASKDESDFDVNGLFQFIFVSWLKIFFYKFYF